MYERNDKISLLHPVLVAKVNNMLSELKHSGLPFAVFETWRSPSNQQAVFDAGNSKAKAWRSWHQYGLAVDFVARPLVGSRHVWSWSPDHDWQTLGKIGIRHGLRWGGNFQSIVDMPHFELPCPKSIYEAEALVKTDGVLALWDLI